MKKKNNPENNKQTSAPVSNATPARTSLVNDAGTFYFSDEFTFNNVKNPIHWILEENVQQKKKDRLTLIISSYGGDLNSAMALVDVMQGSSIPVYTVGLGVIASAGLVTFIAGAKGGRVIAPNTAILSHQYSWGTYGKEHELISAARKFELVSEKMIKHYKKYTGLSEKQIRQYLLPPQDIWLSPEEALKLKLCDKIG